MTKIREERYYTVKIVSTTDENGNVEEMPVLVEDACLEKKKMLNFGRVKTNLYKIKKNWNFKKR